MLTTRGPEAGGGNGGQAAGCAPNEVGNIGILDNDVVSQSPKGTEVVPGQRGRVDDKAGIRVEH